MTKDAFYFQHDSNAKDDPKCMLLIDKIGLVGYGIYWILIETLRDQKDYKFQLKLVPVLAKRYGGDTAMFMDVILNFDLFEIEDEELFYSPSLINRMNIWEMAKDDKRNRAMKGAIARWGKQSTPALPMQCPSNAQADALQCPSNADAMQTDATRREEKRREETIREEIKENNPLLLPLVNDVMDYFDFNERANFDKLRTITQAINLIDHQNLTDHFKAQFAAYKGCKPDKRFRHSFPNFIGTIDNHFIDGAWNAENWTERLSLLKADKTPSDNYSYSDAAAEAKKRLKNRHYDTRTA